MNERTAKPSRAARRSSHLAVGCLAYSFGILLLGLVAKAEPTPIIFDTDIGNDVDDVLALGVLHALESRGECRLLAVTITKDHPLAAAFTRKVNAFYGRPNIPIGVCRSGVTPDEGRFLGLASDPPSEAPTSDAVPLLRAMLTNAADSSVVVIQVGFSTNLAGLLASAPDEISPLSGSDLVARKVKRLSLMAGAFEPIEWGDHPLGPFCEYNVTNDIPAAQRVADEWPTEVVWSGFEVGIAACYPHGSIERDYRYASSHPVVDSYHLYCGPDHDRPSWDLTSVLQAVRPDRDYFTLSPAGRVGVNDDGLTTFRVTERGRHRCLVLEHGQRARLVATLVALASQPPTQIE